MPAGFPRRWSVIVIAGLLAALVGAGLLVELRNPFPALAFAIQRSPHLLPSSGMVGRGEVGTGLPVLSLYVRPADLHDPEIGLLENRLARGVEWERPASVSYFEGGDLRFGAPVGIRIHGGKSREHSPVQSFRLYFRRRYGARQVGAGVLFDGRRDPLRRLVIHNDLREDRQRRWWHFVNPLAYDVARRLGAIVPETHPALVYVNGERQGAYVLTEHVTSPGFLESRFGHTNFTVAGRRAIEELRRWVRRPAPLTAEEVSQRVDLENLTTWFLSMLYCATTDPFQGVMLRDDTAPTPRWFWIVWDMDHSFMDLYARAPVSWQHDTFRTLLRQPEIRSEIVTRLLSDDPAYRERFKRALAVVLNHQLTPGFLVERFEHYANLARAMRISDLSYLPVLHEYLRHRSAWLRERARSALPDGETHPCEIQAPAGVALRVDGYRVDAPFTGHYFSGTSVHVEVSVPPERELAYWLINGRPEGEGAPRLDWPIDGPLTVEAVLR